MRNETCKVNSGWVRPSPLAPSPSSLRQGLTLVEMLVSLVCVLLLMMAYTQLFSDVGSKVGEARSMIELNSRMRSAAQRLRSDLESHTCDMTPWQRPESGSGYFEIIEGPLCDKTPDADASNPVPTNRHNGLVAGAYTGLYDSPPDNPISKYPLGDTDDVLMFTIRSKAGPFIGQSTINAGNPIQSEAAEVVWFLRPTMKPDNVTPVDPPTYTLYRRVFLVVPTWGGGPVSVPSATITSGTNDLSAHDDGTGTGTSAANTLGDLTKRECRFAHGYVTNPGTANGFPHRVDPSKLVPFGGQLTGGTYSISLGSPSYIRYGEDVVLSNVLSFDVQVWDPTVQVKNNGNVAVLPGDPGYAAGAAFTSPVLGGYVNLNNGSGSGTFAGAGNTKSLLNAIVTAPPVQYLQTWMFDDPSPAGSLPTYGRFSQTPATFDTWSFHYEMDGLDQDGNGAFDEGTDQIVGMTGGGGSAYETSPPYPVPLRGLRVRIRCYEPDARDVREVTVTESFVPE